MWNAVIPSGSLTHCDVSVPDWAKPTVFHPIEIGCLARVLSSGGLALSGELVLVLEEVKSLGNNKGYPNYRVVGRLGTFELPCYVLQSEGSIMK